MIGDRGWMETTLQRFRRFVTASRPLLAGARSVPPMDSFRGFIAKATPIATAHARPMIARLAPFARALGPWLVPHDLLEVAGYAHVETAYTSLVGWALFPPERPEVALACQRAWAARVAPGLAMKRAAQPRHQLSTDDGIPDLVLVYDEAVLVVEAKTKSVEHAAPSGDPQTLAYARAVPEALGAEHRSKRCHVAFLTVDGAVAANPEAVACTYAEFGFALASALDILKADDPLRPAYAMLVTHLVRCAVPPGTDLVDVLGRINAWDESSSPARAAEILANLASIQMATSLLLPREGM